MRRRILRAALATVLGTVGLALGACDRAGDDPESSARPTPSSRSSSVDPEAARQAAGLFARAATQGSTVRIGLRVSGRFTGRGSGHADLTPSGRIKADLTVAQDDSLQIRLIATGRTLYLQTPRLDSRFARMPLGRSGSSLLEESRALVAQGSWTGWLAPSLLAPEALVRILESTELDATSVSRRHVSLTLSMTAASTPSDATTAWTIDAWFDRRGRYRRLVFTSEAYTLTEAFSGWGSDFAVTVPPGAQTQTFAELVAGL